jgi:hypothetical protein
MARLRIRERVTRNCRQAGDKTLRKTARLCDWREAARQNEKDPQVLPAGQKSGGEPPGSSWET